MGGCAFELVVESSSAKEGFSRLVKEAVYECGHESYNGTISTCSLGKCTKKYDKYTKTHEKEAYRLIERDCGYKWVASYIDLGVVYYKVYKASKINKEYTGKFQQKFVIYNDSTHEETKYKYDTKTEADKKAIELALSTNNIYLVQKKTIKISGNDVVTEVKLEVKEYKSKPKLAIKSGMKIEEIHKYIFYGIASC